MNGNDAPVSRQCLMLNMEKWAIPCALHTKLLKVRSRDDGFAADKCVGVKQGSADDADV